MMVSVTKIGFILGLVLAILAHPAMAERGLSEDQRRACAGESRGSAQENFRKILKVVSSGTSKNCRVPVGT
jgi:hypothetical protein